MSGQVTPSSGPPQGSQLGPGQPCPRQGPSGGQRREAQEQRAGLIVDSGGDSGGGWESGSSSRRREEGKRKRGRRGPQETGPHVDSHHHCSGPCGLSEGRGGGSLEPGARPGQRCAASPAKRAIHWGGRSVGELAPRGSPGSTPSTFHPRTAKNTIKSEQRKNHGQQHPHHHHQLRREAVQTSTMSSAWDVEHLELNESH